MSKRNYKELWNQLKVILLCSGRQRWVNKGILDTMFLLETNQLDQDPMYEMITTLKKTEKNKK